MKTLSFLKKNSFIWLISILAIFFSSCFNRSSGDGAATKTPVKDTTVKKVVAVNTVKAKDTDTIKTPVGSANTVEDQTFGNIPIDRKYNDIARYIAGMNGNPGSPYIAMESDSVWIRFKKDFNASWKQIEVNRLQKMAAWGETELAQERNSGLDIFYPLSGPDILHANAFFPNAKNYRLYALEINGALPSLNGQTKKATENYLEAVYKSLEDIFVRSYFITHKMNKSLTRNNVDGTLPLICVFLVRTGNEIINLKYFHLNDDGTETLLSKDSTGNHHNDFVKVYFRNSKNNYVQMVSYMKCDLSDEAYSKNFALKNFFTRMPKSITYLKSASYLLHYKFFSYFRDVILLKSEAILEDDTGIPYKYFSKDKWQVTLYGKYVKPVSDFSGVFQTDLLAAYQDTLHTKPKKLPFSLGYHWGSLSQQNLLKAELKE